MDHDLPSPTSTDDTSHWAGHGGIPWPRIPEDSPPGEGTPAPDRAGGICRGHALSSGLESFESFGKRSFIKSNGNLTSQCEQHFQSMLFGDSNTRIGDGEARMMRANKRIGSMISDGMLPGGKKISFLAPKTGIVSFPGGGGRRPVCTGLYH